jgi:hypothetical protein
MRLGPLYLASLALLLGCGGGGGGGGDNTLALDASTGSRECMDEDGDGFGRYCSEGNDCDDGDDTITDECRRCVRPNEGCPCEPGTKPMWCDPPDMRTVMNGVTGVLECKEGTRYCRDGVYSECEILLQYAVFVADE